MCGDLETGSKIAYGQKRYRVVTLDGELIDISGTMSGGGNAKASGGMQSSSNAGISPEQLAELEEDFNAKSNKLQAIRGQKQELEETVDNLSNELNQLQIELPKLEMDIKGRAPQFS